jgi:predicted branched-subunit amino acid permease
MINKDFFLKGYRSIFTHDSPAIALTCCFVAIGALFKNLGFNIQESIFSTVLTYALPGSLVMAESMLIGASLFNIFLAVWIVNARLYPMAVSLFPLMMHKSQPKWKYYFSCHFIAVSAWLIMKSNYKKIPKKNRIDYWIGIGSAAMSASVFGTFLGFFLSEYLNKDMMMGLAILNPVYFLCMLIGASITIPITLSVLLGTILGPVIYLFSPEWSILLAGTIGGTIAYLVGEQSVS